MRPASPHGALVAALAAFVVYGSSSLSSAAPSTRRHALRPFPDPNFENPVPGIEYSSPLRSITYMRPVAGHNRGDGNGNDDGSGKPEPDESAPATHQQTLRAIRGELDGHSAVSALSRVQRHVPGASYQNISVLNRYATQYGIEAEWDGQPIWLIFDTGSSDTWAVQSDFECVDRFGSEYPRAACRHGKHFVDSFRHGPLDSVHFSLRFGSGEHVSGPMGFSDLDVADGLVVTRLQVGLANRTYWRGNNITNGILGLAYPSLTSAYYGQADEDRPQYRLPYAPFFSAMVAQGVVKRPYFSVAIDRNASSGMLAWGGLPPYSWMDGSAAYTDLIITAVNPNRPETNWKYSYYTVVVDGMQWDLTTDMRKFLYIVDTGTTLMYLPPPIAEAIAASYEPRAVFLWQYGSYFAPCNAVPPRLAVVIGGVRFFINPADLIYRDLQDPATGYCQIGIASGGSGPYILGSVFLQNVVAVFDVGAAQMRFYGRK